MTKRNLNLDLLRALAISMVFLAHTVLSFGAPSYLAPLQLGGIGVDLFFVLSGWLIGSQLFKELDDYGNIHIKRFWVRRWMRTLPAYYSVLMLTIIQQYVTKDNFEFPWAYLVFLQNYGDELPIFAVSWSLSVEEQFYLAIAPVVAMLAKLPKAYRTTGLVFLLLIPSVFRYIGFYDSLYETHVRIDCCVMGVLLAHIKYNHKILWGSLNNLHPSIKMLSVILVGCFFINRWLPEPILSDPSPLVLANLFGLWVIFAMSGNWRISKKFNGVIYYVSSRSYAIYLLHPDALAVSSRLLPKDSFLLYFVFSLIITLLLAEFLFRTVESYFMRLRSKFSISKRRVN